jgi:hypothetical protein
MTTTTSYTDEQVIDWAERIDGLTASHSELAIVLRSLLADRQSLQAEVDDFKSSVQSRLENVSPPDTLTLARQEYWKAGARSVIREVNSALVARAKQNETKQAKS